MVDSKENYKFDLGVKGLRPVSCVYNHYLKAVFPKVVLGSQVFNLKVIHYCS